MPRPRRRSKPHVLARHPPGDAVMVKGSLGSRMGPIVKALAKPLSLARRRTGARPSFDHERLTRCSIGSRRFSDTIWLLNVFRYITFRTGGAMITALVFVFLFGRWIIDQLRLKQGKGQPIRSDGPQSHLVTKKGTPTMGGLMILFGIVVSTLLWANPANAYVWIVLGVTLGFGLVGFYDDYLKVTKQTHAGFAGKLRLLDRGRDRGARPAIASSRLGRQPFATSLAFPFFKELVLTLGWFFVVFGAFIIVGAGNAVNLTDGLDGLAIVPVMIAPAELRLHRLSRRQRGLRRLSARSTTCPAPASSRCCAAR